MEPIQIVSPVQTAKRAFIAEDDVVSRAVITNFVQSCGFKAESAASVAEGWKHLSSRSYNLIVLDSHLPDGNGAQLAAQVRAHPTFGLTPILSITSDDSPGNVSALLIAGVDEVMIKPVTKKQVAEAIARVSAGVSKTEQPSAGQPAEGLLNLLLAKLHGGDQAAMAEFVQITRAGVLLMLSRRNVASPDLHANRILDSVATVAQHSLLMDAQAVAVMIRSQVSAIPSAGQELVPDQLTGADSPWQTAAALRRLLNEEFSLVERDALWRYYGRGHAIDLICLDTGLSVDQFGDLRRRIRNRAGTLQEES